MFSNLSGLVVGLVALGIILAVGFLILSNILSNASVAADGNATAAVTSTITAAAGIPTWLGVIVIVVIGALLIGLVAMFRQ